MEKKQKRAKGAQRKELVNEIGLETNKFKGKGRDNWVREA